MKHQVAYFGTHAFDQQKVREGQVFSVAMLVQASYIRSKRRTSSSRPSIVAHKAHSDGLDERRNDAISFDEKAMARYEDDARRLQGHEGPEGHEGREAQAGRKEDGHKINATHA